MKERFEMIKKDLIESKRIIVEEDDYIKSDSILMRLFDDGHLHWLVEQVELLNDALKGASIVANRASDEIKELKQEVEIYKTGEQMCLVRLERTHKEQAQFVKAVIDLISEIKKPSSKN